MGEPASTFQQPGGTTATVVARPKTSRRPATFSGVASGATPPADWVTLPPHTEAAKVTDIAAPTAWQDDPRFAVSLILLVAVVNIVASLWLSAITPTAPATESRINAAPLDNERDDASIHVLDETSEQ